MSDEQGPGASEWVPEGAGLARLRAAAPDCRGCELWRPATQVVFSTGAASARIVLVGEQPGDQEDLEGVPFVGPARRLLAHAIDATGIPRRDIYVTNAVKHFRFEQRCRDVRIGAERGRVLDESVLPVLITTHPSALLRTRGAAERKAAFDAFVGDLAIARDAAS